MRSSDVPQMGHACARVRLVTTAASCVSRGMRLSAVCELRAVFAAQTILMLL
jgi:hypothetical protein